MTDNMRARNGARIVRRVAVEGYTGRLFMGKKLKKIDVTIGPAGTLGILYDDTAFAAEIGQIIANRKF